MLVTQVILYLLLLNFCMCVCVCVCPTFSMLVTNVSHKMLVTNIRTRRKVLKVTKIKDANYGCKYDGNDDGVSYLSVVS